MNNEIKCPMTFGDPCGDREEGCRRERCAWWLEDKQRCAVAEIGLKVGAKK